MSLIQKYRTCGQGIGFSDVVRGGLPCPKKKTQRILKDCCQQRIGKEGPLAPMLFRLQKRTSPQRYYPSVRRADIFENLKQRGNVPIRLTEPSSSSPSNVPASTELEQQKAQNLLDALFLLRSSPLYIHSLQLQLCIEPGYYTDTDIQTDCSEHNKSKQYEEKIGTAAVVKYLVYPSGKIMVFVACSNNPFKLEDAADEITLYSFLGQVRDRLLHVMADPRERIVPPITKFCEYLLDLT